MTIAHGDEDEFRFREQEAAEFGIRLPLLAASRESTTDAGGRDVSAIRHGSSEPDVIFLHGAALNAHTWDATTAAIGRPALAVDLPGHGDSAWRDDADYRPVQLAESVLTFLHRHSTPHLLVGQSLGGLTAALVAARDSSSTGVVLVDITPDVGADEASPISAFLAGPQDFASRDDIVDAARAAGIGVSRESVARGVALNTRVRADGRIVFSHHLAALGGLEPSLHSDPEHLWTILENLAVPIVLVRASRGFVSADMAQTFARRLPQARVMELDTGHNIQEDDPVGLARIINDVLTRTHSGPES